MMGVGTASAATVNAPGCTATVSNANTAELTRMDTQCVLTFTTGSNAWTVPSGMDSVRVLVVGGGGGGGQNGGGGGGGGQVVHNASFSVTPNASLSVSIGAAGAGPGTQVADWDNAGGLGGTTSFSTISALGGGGGGTRGGNPHANNGQPGYTGGGGGGSQTTGGIGSSGAHGGNGHEAGCDATGGGGGGASGASGTAGAYRDGGDGGNGVASDISGTSRHYGGGGAGGGTCDNSQGQTWSGTPGLGGGATASQAALANTGGGGGGGGAVGWSLYGGAGGSGVVILSWQGLALAPSSLVSPTISGSTEFGATLTGTTGNWSQSPTGYSYRWLRGSTPSGSFTPINAATGLTYTLTDDDIDMHIKFEVQATNSVGFETDTSTASAKVTNLPISVSPILGTTSSTSDGFVFNITNLNSLTSYTLSVTSSVGTVSRSTEVVTVTGLAGGSSATVTVTSSRSGYRDVSATITGTASTQATTIPTVNTENNSAEASSPVSQPDVPRTSASTSPTVNITLPPTTSPLNTTIATTTTSTTTTTTTVPTAPAADPGEASVAVDGVAVNATVTRSNNQLVIDAGPLSATISGRTADGAPASLDSDGNIRLEEGDSLVFEANGFNPNSALEVWLFSSPTKLGVAPVSSSGSTSGVFVLPPGIDAGKHRVVLSGTNPDESEAVFAVGIVVGGNEGVSTVGRVLIALPLVLAMVAAFAIPARRRRHKQITS